MAKVALVTGAGTGIGKAVALTLQRNGYSVVLAGRRFEPLEATAREAMPGKGEMIPIAADVTNPRDVAALFGNIEEHFGRLDVLFNNAGVSAPAVAIDELKFDQWRSVISVNLDGAFLCAQAAFRMMKQQYPQGGRIINNGSISAYTPRPNSAPYTASKHAITGLTKSLSLDGRPYDIACSQIDIGNAATDMTEKMTDGVLQANGERAPEPRINVQHVAEAVLYMADLPLSANVQFMTIMATKMPYVGRG